VSETVGRKKVAQELNEQGYKTKSWTTKKGKERVGTEWNTAQVYRLLNNRLYIGEIAYKGNNYPGEHESLIKNRRTSAIFATAFCGSNLVPDTLTDNFPFILGKGDQDSQKHSTRMERPALQRLLADIDAGKIDVIVVYKIDRLSRSLLDFMKMIELFNEKEVSFVSVTQPVEPHSD
jgi:hypothetical protein